MDPTDPRYKLVTPVLGITTFLADGRVITVERCEPNEEGITHYLINTINKDLPATVMFTEDALTVIMQSFSTMAFCDMESITDLLAELTTQKVEDT